MDHEKYQISIERDGRMVPVGSISGESYRTATFSYIEEYLDDRNAVPVSISLPLQRENFSAEQTRRFFEGLLPEGFTTRSVAQLLHLENRGRSFCFRPHVFPFPGPDSSADNRLGTSGWESD